MSDHSGARGSVDQELARLAALAAGTTPAAERSATAREFGRRVARARQALGLSQGALATATGLSQAGLSHIEAGRRTPSIETARVIAKAVGGSVGGLMGERGAALTGREAEFLAAWRAASPEIQAEVERFLRFRLSDR